MGNPETGLPRRRFLGLTALAALGAALGSRRPALAAEPGTVIAPADRPSPRTAILVYDKADELAVFGPREVFGLANQAGMRKGSTYLVAEKPGPVELAHGTTVGADFGLDKAPAPDILIVPGGPGVTAAMSNPDLVKFIATAARTAQWTASVCSGAMLLVLSGVGSGRRMTTHRTWIEPLKKANKPEMVVEGAGFVRDGTVVSSSGMPAGLDMSLWLVEQVYGEAAAGRVRALLEYDPGPIKPQA